MIRPKKWHKYQAKPVTIDGHKFPSKKEAIRYQELKLQQKAGFISGLELQPKFILQEKFDYQGKTIREIQYIADFRYKKDGQTIVEDTKGYREKYYTLKKKLFLFRYRDLIFIES